MGEQGVCLTAGETHSIAREDSGECQEAGEARWLHRSVESMAWQGRAAHTRAAPSTSPRAREHALPATSASWHTHGKSSAGDERSPRGKSTALHHTTPHRTATVRRYDGATLPYPIPSIHGSDPPWARARKPFL